MQYLYDALIAQHRQCSQSGSPGVPPSPLLSGLAFAHRPRAGPAGLSRHTHNSLTSRDEGPTQTNEIIVQCVSVVLFMGMKVKRGATNAW